MKKILISLLSLVVLISFFSFNSTAVNNTFVPYVIDFVVTTNMTDVSSENESRATGLIASYSLSLAKSGTTLNIEGMTNCSQEVIKCGFKNLIIQRRKTSSDSWEDYYDYGNVYVETCAAGLSTTLVVETGYQYRISCKHYAKKNILSVETIANTSNIVNV